jgi:hypothetical protein
MEGRGNYGMEIPLFIAEFAYNIVQKDLINLDMTPAQELDPVLEPI